jgi:MFS transporter, AAHS family, 4-hydroxybenzoate transporter
VAEAAEETPAGAIAHVVAEDSIHAAAALHGSSSFSWAVALCFGAVLLDGLDTSSIGVAGPAIAAQFDVAAASLTGPFVMTSVGAVIGYVLSGSLVDRWGARRVLIASAAGFGILSLATPYAGSIMQLAFLRLFTAIGLGAALPSAISVAIEQSPVRLRETVAAIVATGLAAGGVLGGMLGGVVMKRYGWESLFYIGGVLPLLLSACLWRWLPANSLLCGPTPTSVAASFAPARHLLAKANVTQTICLWAFSFLIFADAYAFLFWLPPLLIGMGHSPESALVGIGVFSAGGLFANIGLVLLVSRYSVASVMLVAASAAALFVLCIVLAEVTSGMMWISIAGVGGGLIACSVGQSALAISIYAPALRTTGVGFSAAAGRVGSIAGPAATGLLFALGFAPQWILVAASAPILVAALVLMLLGKPRARGFGGDAG